MSDYVCDQTFVAAQNRWITACGYRDVPEPDHGWVADLLTNGWFIAGAYIAIGLVLGRVAWTLNNRYGDEYCDESGMIAIGALFWPLTLFLLGAFWFMSGGARRDDKRKEERRERARQLRVDALAWDEKRRAGTDAEKAMAGQLADMCRQQADDLERTT